MTTRQLAEELTFLARHDGHDAACRQVYRKLLTFLATDYSDGYGANEGERGRERDFADTHGYFWCPCVLCGRWFSGREALKSTGLSLTAHEGVMVCPSPECAAEVERLHALYPNGVALRVGP